jgi:hypothetical protein
LLTKISINIINDYIFSISIPSINIIYAFLSTFNLINSSSLINFNNLIIQCLRSLFNLTILNLFPICLRINILINKVFECSKIHFFLHFKSFSLLFLSFKIFNKLKVLKCLIFIINKFSNL